MANSTLTVAYHGTPTENLIGNCSIVRARREWYGSYVYLLERPSDARLFVLAPGGFPRAVAVQWWG